MGSGVLSLLVRPEPALQGGFLLLQASKDTLNQIPLGVIL